jgi:hypothetical protein
VLSMLGMLVLPFGATVGAGGSVEFVRFDVLSELAAGADASDDVMPLGFLVAIVALVGFCLWRTARSGNDRVALG